MAIFAIMTIAGCLLILEAGSKMALRVSDEDYNDLKSGNMRVVRNRYENRLAGLTIEERTVLCNIYIMHVAVGKALECLSDLETRAAALNDGLSVEKIAGKKALIRLTQGQAASAKELTDSASYYGGQYINALAHLRMGKRRRALELAEKWAKHYKPKEKYYAAALYVAVADYEKALKVLKNKVPPMLSRSYSLTGGGDSRQKTVPFRLDIFEDFVYGPANTFSFGPPGNVYVEFLLAKSLLETGQRTEALKRFEAIIKDDLTPAYREIHWRALYELGRIAKFEADKDKAINYVKSAIKIIQLMRASVNTDAGRIGFIGDKQHVYHEIVRLLLDTGQIREAFEYVEANRSRALVDLLADQERFGRRGSTTDQLVKELALAEDEYYSLAAIPDVTSQQVSVGLRKVTDIGKKIMREGGQVASLITARGPNASDIANHLAPDEALVEYFQVDTSLRVFVVTDDKIWKEKPSEVPNLNQHVDDYLAALKNKEVSALDQNARLLYGELIDPVMEILNEIGFIGVKRLTIVPHGKLHYLPFAALRSKDQYLIEKYSLRILPSAATLTYLRSNESKSEGALIVANPEREPRLEYAGDEADSVERIFLAKSKRLDGKEATRKAFLSNAHEYQYIHIAAHGVFDESSALQSRILLTHEHDERTGDLTVADLFELDSPLNAKLVVLSACETAVGAHRIGGDIIGMQRGFFYAGSEGLIGSLWPIHDKSTATLMTNFYSELRKNEIPDALQQAQISMIKDSQFFHPLHWAAFTYSGLAWATERN